MHPIRMHTAIKHSMVAAPAAAGTTISFAAYAAPTKEKAG
jgi:hypothetical protein